MKAKRIDASNDALLDAASPAWASALGESMSMAQTPLMLTKEVSPFLALGQDHGAIENLQAAALHNGRMLAVRLQWAAPKYDRIVDLDSFVDGAAVLFPLVRGAPAVTMGAPGKPTNAWYWKANKPEPYEVVAEGFASVQRVAGRSDLKAVAQYRDGQWNVVLGRSLGKADGLVKLEPGGSTKIAFAVWSGGNAERSGRKSFSGEFVDLEILK
ncbi:ethylbenzene dehydrogenase-related protein [Thauera aromatica]|nr:ethylbenzene dehydrogenase-related protein [Thauera aromatica]MCK2127384.1 ethylbenzene dehydrogenase-related protein [Thauera aromatica]